MSRLIRGVRFIETIQADTAIHAEVGKTINLVILGVSDNAGWP